MAKMISEELELRASLVRKDLRDYLKRWGLSARQVARYMEMHYNSVYYFLEGRRQTYGRTMEKIEEFLKEHWKKDEVD